MDFKDYLLSKNRETYERYSFDSFLEKKGFSFDIPFIHVTGTNGKGSTCKYLSSILIDAGYKVGLFMSPYFIDPCEMISINDKNISNDEFASFVKDNEKLFDKYELSEFEIETYIAYEYFKKEKCDICIIECGMGGLDDATNIATPILSIITSVSLEHTSSLGKSVSEIAFAKAGIIKEEVPVVISDDLPEDAINAITKVAKENSSPIILKEMSSFERIEGDCYVFSMPNLVDLKIKTLSSYSIKDATFAVTGIKAIKESFKVSEDNIRNGLLSMKLKGRMTIIRHNPLIVIDGAHNPEAIAQLVKDINSIKIGKIHGVFACFTDKNINIMLPSLGLACDDITLTTFQHKRARRIDDYFLYLDEYKFEDNHIEIIKKLIKENPDDTILICGSLAFALLVENEFDKGVYND